MATSTSHRSIPTHATIDSEGATFVSTSHRSLTLAMVHDYTSHHTRTTRSIGRPTTSSSHSSSIRPTRTGEDTSRPKTYYVTSYGHSPIMTEIPRDYDDGYGYGDDSSTTPAVDGGYGSPPGPTDLPPGGYGNPLSPEMDESTILTVSEPATVTVSLEFYTSSSVLQSTPTIAAPVIVTETLTSTPSSHSPVQDVTVTVTASKSTPSLSLSSTRLVPTGISLSTEGYVYTTVTASSSLSHTASSTDSIMYTPSARPSPKPVTNANASELHAKVNWLLMFSVGALACMTLWLPTTYVALALAVGCLGLLFSNLIHPSTAN
ncbi:hypothetical protein F5Y05DRAFT_416661 [Hypoxylon sp. FL0543]|nr:hypothetical protein F5Y05DRAFT_416661 [Hypoxylon sp. FL0543]